VGARLAAQRNPVKLATPVRSPLLARHNPAAKRETDRHGGRQRGGHRGSSSLSQNPAKPSKTPLLSLAVSLSLTHPTSLRGCAPILTQDPSPRGGPHLRLRLPRHCRQKSRAARKRAGHFPVHLQLLLQLPPLARHRWPLGRRIHGPGASVGCSVGCHAALRNSSFTLEPCLEHH
jgi:hypothetical protein